MTSIPAKIRVKTQPHISRLYWDIDTPKARRAVRRLCNLPSETPVDDTHVITAVSLATKRGYTERKLRSTRQEAAYKRFLRQKGAA